MMRNIVSLIGLFSLILTVSCGEPTQSKNKESIDVALAMSEQSPIKVSQLFESVRYIPLETSDSCLIGESPSVQLIQDKILITTHQKQCFLFDKKSGKFLCEVGHLGNDPGGYSGSECWTDEKAGLIYFPGWDNHLVCYDLKGTYVGKTKTPLATDAFSMPRYTHVNGDTLVGFYPNLAGQEKKRLLFFNKQGDSLSALPNNQSAPSFEIEYLSVFKGEEAASKYTMAALQGLFILAASDSEITSLIMLGNTNFWHSGAHTYFREAYNDTIFRIEGMELIPDRIFDLGEYHWPYEDRYRKKQDKHIYITQVLDSERLLFFRFVKGLFNDDNRTPFNACFLKSSGKVLLNEQKAALEDDINHFLPLQPLNVSVDGEYAGILSAEEIHEWLEDEKNAIPEKVSYLKSIQEDDNPVIVLMK